ncbi:hypothetical protein SAMN04488008_103142 [Maribacter orientalis]|uniref:Uncharacterized protein n=1 Tax=Maribacter orientalis TaxID=228957 RepID=A0A1H7NE03_9FLAO|nr:hypothetical protein [Maribacter orientalis]SEL21215.1 hypothetical protein SAMN04488008_103142 [Maribacter orientalis]
MRVYFKFSILFLFILSCKETTKPTQESLVNEVTETDIISIPKSWVDGRVNKAKEKLGTSEAGEIVWNAMEAHGGLDRWYANGPLSFRFNYQPLDGKTARDSYQTLDTWSNRAVHTSATDSTAHFGWTGEQAWVKAKDSTSFEYDTKFWALTPLYFYGQPFVLNGEGVNLELLPEVTYKEQKQDVVKVTFDAGTGDAPDDYYILYFSKESHKLVVIRYIVSYPEYFKDGGHAPEKFMEVMGENTVNGILFPTSYKTYWLTKDKKPGEYITQIDVSNVSFENDLPKDFFDVPKDAKTLN